MIQETLKKEIEKALSHLGIQSENITLEHPGESKNGDFSTNISLALAKKEGMNPRELAEKIVAELSKNKIKEIEKIDIAGPGFINFYLSREFFTETTKEILKKKNDWGKNDVLKGKKIMVEYTDPNPFKPFHIGHLMTNAIGESLSRIVEFSGADTVRANYQGDVGPHVAKAIYGLMQSPLPENLTTPILAANYIGECYARGSDAYESNPEIKLEIDTINRKVYEKSDPEINKLYDWGRKVTLEAFEEIYQILGTKFDHYFFESEMAEKGVEIVKDNTPEVFTESEGAVIFQAEKHNPKLHTRVFITSQGLPTYETKELGLTKTKFEDINPDLSIVVTANEQADYMRVVTAAIQILHPDWASRMRHITHGMMKFASGKMSSRKGNIVTGESLLRDSMKIVEEKIADRGFTEEIKKNVAEEVGVAALKYSILHQAIGGDIIYDFEKSISFEGDSGPYLQYSATRAQSVLKKAEGEGICASYKDVMAEITVLERELYKFPEIIERANENMGPHHVVTYLIELASAFNSFYATYQVVNKNDPYSYYKVALTEAFYTTMKNGLWLLGIKTPEKM